MKIPCKDKSEQVLLVEGKNDCHVIMALCKQFSLPEQFGIFDCEGDIKVLKRLNALIPGPDPPKTIDILLDADRDGVLKRWNQIKQKIKSHNYAFPEQPELSGTILPVNPGKPRLGIWLMPNN